MSKKKKRIDTHSEPEPLTHSPFGALRGASPEKKPSAPDTKQQAPPAENSPADSRPYHVARTRKGNWPLRVENRGSGKVVTVVERVEGDAGHLLKALQKHCGAGGAAYDDRVEVQGSHEEKISAFLEAE